MVLWTVVLAALFSGNRLVSDYVFLVIMVFLAVTGLAEFYGLVEKRGLVCFKRWGILGGMLLMVGTFLHLTGQLGLHGSPARVNDFETSFLILFVLGLCVRQFVSRSNTAGILAISTTLFGLMYVPWLLNFIQKINFFPGVDGQLLRALFHAGHQVQRHGRLCGRLADRPAQDDPAHQPGQDLGGLRRRHRGLDAGQPGLRRISWASKMAGMNWMHAMILGVLLSVAAVVGRSDRIALQTRGRREGLGQVLPRHRRHSRLAGQPAV